MPVNACRKALPLVLLLHCIVLSSLNANAQAPAQQPPTETPRNELGIFGVIPLANGSLKGVTSDRRFYLFGLSYSRVLGHSRVCDVRWVSEIMPVELLSEPFIKGTEIQTLAAAPRSLKPSLPTVWGPIR